MHAKQVAVGRIVVLCNTMTKEEMDYQLAVGLEERGISPKRTKVLRRKGGAAAGAVDPYI